MNKREPDLVRPTAEEEAEIAAQLAEDPDAYEWTEEDWATPRPPGNSSPRPTSGRCGRRRPCRTASSSG